MGKNIKPIIIKFGGTSVSTKDRIETICSIVQKEMAKNPIVVVSALRGVTDLLLSLTTVSQKEAIQILLAIEKKHSDLIRSIWKGTGSQRQINLFIEEKIKEIKTLLKNKKRDEAFQEVLVSFGEIMSAYIIAEVLRSIGIYAVPVIATELIVTDANFTAAEFDVEPTCKKVEKVITPLLKEKKVPVVTGFIGATKDGKTTTLGRGGSDYTASILGFCLHAQEIQIWTDVDGIYTADPRIVKKARLIPAISFKEASEMAFLGSKILHPRTIRPAIKRNIPVYVFNTLNPTSQGTTITASTKHTYPITAISFKRNVTLVNMYATEMLFQKGFLGKIFNTYAKHNISIDLVSVSEVSVSVTLDNDTNLSLAIEELEKRMHVTVIKNNSIISIIGEGITSSAQTMKNIFELLYKKQISVKMISFSATNINVSFVIESEKLEEALKVLHNQLLLKQWIHNI